MFQVGFKASADQHSAIWVNGDKFELSPEAGFYNGSSLGFLWSYSYCINLKYLKWGF